MANSIALEYCSRPSGCHLYSTSIDRQYLWFWRWNIANGEAFLDERQIVGVRDFKFSFRRQLIRGAKGVPWNAAQHPRRFKFRK
jgi:hypothetical protein